MDKQLFNLLTELVVMMDKRITEGEQIRQGAIKEGRNDLIHYSDGKISGYLRVAAWAREKLTTDQPAEDTGHLLASWV